MAMSNSMDISSKNGIILSKNIAQLSADLASFYNTDVDSAFEALNSVFTGQVRTLRQYGLNISEANLEQYRLAKGIKVAYSAMTEQQKVLLRYNYIMEHTRDIQGDFAKTSATVANQWRLLQMNARSLAGTLGSFLLPVLQTVLTYLNAIIRALNSFFGRLAQMVGITTPSYAAGIAVGNDVAEGWDNAAGAAAKYKATIAGFDELETLNPQGGGSGGGAGAGGLTGEDLFPEGLLSYDVDDNTKQLDLSLNHLIQLLDDKIQEIRGKAEELSGAFGEKVNGFVNYVDWPLMGKTVGDGLNLIVNSFDRFLEKIDFKNLGSKFAEGVNSIFSTVEWDEIGHNFSLRFNAVFDTIRGFLDKFDFSNAASGLLTSFKTAMAEIKWEEAGETIGIGINKVFGFLDELLNGKIVSDLGVKIATAINKAVSTVDAAQIGRVADGFLTQILAAIDAIDWRQIGNKLNEAFKNSNIIGHLIEAITETLKIRINVEGGIFGGLFNLPPGLGKTLFAIGSGIAFLATTALKAAAPIVNLGAKLALFNASINIWHQGLNWLFDGKVRGGQTFFEALSMSAETHMPTLEILGQVFETLGKKVKLFGTALIHPLASIQKLGTVLSGLFTKIIAFIGAHPAALIVAGIALVVAAIATLWKNSEEFRNNITETWNNHIKPTLQAIGDAVKELWENHLQPFWDKHLKPSLNNLWNGLTYIWSKISGWIGVVVQVVFSSLGGLIDFISIAIDKITTILGGIIDILSGIISFIKGDFEEGWETAWNGVASIFDAIFPGISQTAKTVLNGVIGFVNGALGGISTAINKVSGWLSGAKEGIKSFFGKVVSLPSFQYSVIPKLASGGVLDSPTVAMLGEYANAKSNPEIAAPQSLLEAIIGNGNDDVISVLIPLLRQINASIEDKDFSITIGDDTIAASAQRGNKNYQRRTGKTLFGY